MALTVLHRVIRECLRNRSDTLTLNPSEISPEAWVETAHSSPLRTSFQAGTAVHDGESAGAERCANEKVSSIYVQ